MLRCSRCGFIGDRDIVAVANLYKKLILHPRCGGLGVLLNAPKPGENPSGMRGSGDGAMKITSTNINLHES
jgi:transposase